jgi:hypothetical protein
MLTGIAKRIQYEQTVLDNFAEIRGDGAALGAFAAPPSSPANYSVTTRHVGQPYICSVYGFKSIYVFTILLLMPLLGATHLPEGHNWSKT